MFTIFPATGWNRGGWACGRQHGSDQREAEHCHQQNCANPLHAISVTQNLQNVVAAVVVNSWFIEIAGGMGGIGFVLREAISAHRQSRIGVATSFRKP